MTDVYVSRCSFERKLVQLPYAEIVLLIFKSPERTRYVVFYDCPLCYQTHYNYANAVHARQYQQGGMIFPCYPLNRATKGLIQQLARPIPRPRLLELAHPPTFVLRDLLLLHCLDDSGLEEKIRALDGGQHSDDC